MSETSAGQAFLAMIESDLLTTGGAPLMAFFQADLAANGDKMKQAAALLQLIASGPAAGLTFLAELEGQLLGLAITKLQAAMAAKVAAAVVPAPGASTTA